MAPSSSTCLYLSTVLHCRHMPDLAPLMLHQLAESDPVATTLISAALREGLGQAQAVHGQALHERLAQLDPCIAALMMQATAAAAAAPVGAGAGTA